MLKNIKIILAYEGTHYAGWQKTAMGPTIEQTLTTLLEKIVRHPIHLQAASRTDAGVHAEGQVVNFFTTSNYAIRRLHKSLNALLPSDISAMEMEEAAATFHPTLDSRGKEYHYFICLGDVQLPVHRYFSWHFGHHRVDVKNMRQAALRLVGKHDFSALTNERRGDNIREIFSIACDEITGERLQIRVSGNNFLYKMVRNIVGTLLYVGCEKLRVEDIGEILQSRKRSRSGVTAPAHGLVLKRVLYDESK